MRSSLPLLLAVAGLRCAAITIDLGSLDQYLTDQETPDHVLSDEFRFTETDDGAQLSFGDDVQQKIKEALAACEEMNDECFQSVYSPLAQSYIHFEGQPYDELRRAAPAELEKRIVPLALGVVQVLGAAATLIMGLWAGERLTHEDDFLVMSLKEDKLLEFEALGSEEISVVAGGQPVVSIPATPLESPSLQGSEEPSVAIAENGGVSFNVGADLCERMPDFIMRTVNCRDGQDGTTGEALCGAEALIRNISPGGAFNDLLLLDTEDLGLEVKESAGALYDASLSMLDFVDDYAYQLHVDERDAEQLGLLMFAMALQTVEQTAEQGQSNLCGSIDLDMETFTNADAGQGGGGSGTGGGDEECPDLVCGLEGEDCPLEFSGSEDNPTVCGEHPKYSGCPCDAPSQAFPRDVTEGVVAFILDISEKFGSDSNDAETRPSCEGEGVTEVPRDVFSGEESSVHGKFCESWDAGTELSMTTDAWGESVQRLLKGRAPPADPSAFEGISFELKYKPSDGNADCQKECNDAFATLKSACSSAGGQGQMREGGRYDIGCGVVTFKISPRNEPEDDEEEEEEEEEEVVDHTDLYDPESYDGISLNRADWQCTYFAHPLDGRPICNCRGGCETEGSFCDKMPTIEGDRSGCSATGVVILSLTGARADDGCDTCEPWISACQYTWCRNRHWDDCTECHKLE